MAESVPVSARAPAFYAARRGAGRGGLADWWTLLHPPYTAWHLSYVVVGASLAPDFDGLLLLATVVAFFLAVGVAAHALDELHGRPLRTGIPRRTLVAATTFGLAGAVALGLAGLSQVGVGLVPFIVIGTVLVVGYNLELAGGRLHTSVGFAAAWGAFPVLTAYYAQAATLDAVAFLAAGAAFALSWAQWALSTPARTLRRRTVHAQATLLLRDGRQEALDTHDLLAPLERALRSLTWAIVAFAASLALARLGGGW